MSDIFSRLAARAGDLAPRARPQIAPRYAKRAPPLVEEVEIETPHVSTKSAPPWTQAASDPRPPLAQEPAAPKTESPPLAQKPAAPKTESPLLAQKPAAPPVMLREEIERVSPETLQPPSSIAERSIERRVESRFERTLIVERPPVAVLPPMRAPDVAALRPPEAKRAAADAPARFARTASAARIQDLSEAASEVIHVSIGRIEVRAVSAPPPRAPPERPRQAPMGLDEYLRRRNEAL